MQPLGRPMAARIRFRSHELARESAANKLRCPGDIMHKSARLSRASYYSVNHRLAGDTSLPGLHHSRLASLDLLEGEFTEMRTRLPFLILPLIALILCGDPRLASQDQSQTQQQTPAPTRKDIATLKARDLHQDLLVAADPWMKPEEYKARFSPQTYKIRQEQLRPGRRGTALAGERRPRAGAWPPRAAAPFPRALLRVIAPSWPRGPHRRSGPACRGCGPSQSRGARPRRPASSTCGRVRASPAGVRPG